jgi:hypothetical protein
MSRLEQVIAYVDGELAAADAAAFEAEMAADPALASEVAAHRAVASRVGGAYAHILDEQVPLRLRLASEAANDRVRRGWIPWAAAAASLAVGVVAGRSLDAPPLAVGHAVPGRLQVARVLDRGLASEAGPVRIGLTFRDAGGRYCRTFQSEPDKLAGLACRSSGAWRLETASAWRPDPQPTYRTAASATPPAILAAVDARLSGEVLDAARERAARDAGWKR